MSKTKIFINSAIPILLIILITMPSALAETQSQPELKITDYLMCGAINQNCYDEQTKQTGTDLIILIIILLIMAIIKIWKVKK